MRKEIMSILLLSLVLILLVSGCQNLNLEEDSVDDDHEHGVDDEMHEEMDEHMEESEHMEGDEHAKEEHME